MPDTTQFQTRLCSDKTATIANGQTESDKVSLVGTSLVGITFPSTFDGTAITFKVSDTLAGTFVPYTNIAGTVVSATVTASTALGLVPSDFAGYNFIQIVAGTSQTGETVLTLKSRPL